jgi:hypothetical protein
LDDGGGAGARGYQLSRHAACGGEAGYQQAFKRMENLDRLTLSVLRAHLGAEQCLNDYLKASGVKRKWFKNKTFWDKTQRAG